MPQNWCLRKANRAFRLEKRYVREVPHCAFTDVAQLVFGASPPPSTFLSSSGYRHLRTTRTWLLEAKDEVKMDEDIKNEVKEETLKSNTVADWEPSRRGPALPSSPKHKRRHELEDTSSSGSEVR
ncbi:unnamed protein product [Cylicocyclus nassatus]|uniref:Uncharacterized protein n=1 Tax=Cylicocyclus nassatus TaxID=53992 RepID=A0AA36GIT9_CYLNA|nr:unnamed protein product [Cylicocyclus nassatus]